MLNTGSAIFSADHPRTGYKGKSLCTKKGLGDAGRVVTPSQPPLYITYDDIYLYSASLHDVSHPYCDSVYPSLSLVFHTTSLL